MLRSDAAPGPNKCGGSKEPERAAELGTTGCRAEKSTILSAIPVGEGHSALPPPYLHHNCTSIAPGGHGGPPLRKVW